MLPPPLLELDVVEYHWYPKEPVPPEGDTLNAVGVKPVQPVWVAGVGDATVGWLTTVTLAVAVAVAVIQPEPLVPYVT